MPDAKKPISMAFFGGQCVGKQSIKSVHSAENVSFKEQ